jgi:hypothetical protein
LVCISEVDLVLRDDLKELGFSNEDDFDLHRHKDLMKAVNQPPRPGIKHCKNKIISHPGHPSFKRRGNLNEQTELRYSNQFTLIDPPCKIFFIVIKLTAMPFKGA